MTGSKDGENGLWFSSPRRDVLRAVGAGGALAMVGGAAVAQEAGDGSEGGTDDGTDDGAGGPSGGSAGGVVGVGTVHEVFAVISGPPTNPERPADFYYSPTGLHAQVGDVLKFTAATPDHNLTSYHPALGMQRRVPVDVDPITSPILGWRPETIPGDMIDPPGEPSGGEMPTHTATAAPGGDATETEAADTEATPTPTPEGDSQPELVPQSFLYQFEVPGVYDFLCSPHEVFGMVLRVVVGDVTEAPFETSDPDALPEPRAGPVGLARGVLTDPALEPSAIVEAGTVDFSELVVNGGSTGGGEPTTTPTPGADGDETDDAATDSDGA